METKTRTQRFYKLLLSLAFLGFLFPSLSNAQVWGYSYPYYYGCFSGPGCSRAAKAVTIMGLSFGAIDTAVGVHRAIKQQELQNEMLHEQAADIRSMVYGPQVYQNAKSVEGFFEAQSPQNQNRSQSPQLGKIRRGNSGR